MQSDYARLDLQSLETYPKDQDQKERDTRPQSLTFGY